MSKKKQGEQGGTSERCLKEKREEEKLGKSRFFEGGMAAALCDLWNNIQNFRR
ncbi:MAG: hypothetical protein SFY81_01155 [Verrucomicrobiota bacterium]|nr:hypothetical protein [Verrucomicrobiota bacterium]